MTIHVVGAGLAGLAAALELAEAGHAVTVLEAGPVAGGRCRSYFDQLLGARIDNGNHLVLSGNAGTMAYLGRLGTRHLLGGPGRALFPFFDAATGERWALEPDPGRIPWWVFRPARRVPGTRLAEYLQLLRLRGARGTVAEALDTGSALYRRLLEPLAVAALNTRPEEGLARLLDVVVRGTLGSGGAACIPLYPRAGLSEAFIDPAVARLRALGAAVETSRRIAALTIEEGRVVALETSDGRIAVDALVLAVPAPVAGALLPGLTVPDAFDSIANVHFRCDAAPPGAIGEAGFVGLVGGTAEWAFLKPGIVSVTISAASRLGDMPADEIAARSWADVKAALALPGAMPPVRVVRERRATFAATAAQEARRPGPRVGIANLALAGDWTATGLPATIEGAIRSGRTAANALMDAGCRPKP
jgi:squalene-associated FAD-dependent desaturase